MKVLLVNAGSSTIKCSLLESSDRSVLARSSAEVVAGGYGEAVKRILGDLPQRPAAVGHRIVHGGDMAASMRVTPAVKERIAALAVLAPLHNPPGMEAMEAAQRALPDVPHVAVFDTAFHATLPAAAYTYPLPHTWTSDYSIRRYGFHGMSHAYSARRAPELLGRKVDRLVICHLGHGCSATAVLRGRSVQTTMGFTPLDGLMMATRSGSLDPGILTHLQRQYGLSAAEIDDDLNHRAGLLGVSGVSADMREVLAAGTERAELAIEMFVLRVREAIGALAAALGGIEALVFTAGIGENSHEIRERVCRGLEFLGIELDSKANKRTKPDADIATPASRTRVLVIAAREDLTMLAEVVRVIGDSSHGNDGIQA